MPVPAIYVADTGDANAFATGRSPGHAALIVTRDLLRALDHEELAGVIAHELSHIRSRDSWTLTVTRRDGGEDREQSKQHGRDRAAAAHELAGHKDGCAPPEGEGFEFPAEDNQDRRSLAPRRNRRRPSGEEPDGATWR